MKLLICLAFFFGVCHGESPYPLPPFTNGCPRMRYWDVDGCNSRCPGFFTNHVDHTWRATHNEMYLDDSKADNGFRCCNQLWTGTQYCSAWFGPVNLEGATCVYADNYCPTLDVEAADSESCAGQFTQHHDKLWIHTEDSSIELTLTGRDDDKNLVLKCSKGGQVFGKALSYVCNNPEMDRPLQYGHNRIDDEDYYIVGGDMLNEGSFFKAFQVTTPPSGADWIKVWVLSDKPLPLKETMVFATPFNGDESETVVYLKDIYQSTFSLRIASSDGVHGQETVNIVMAKEGVHAGEGDNVVLVGHSTIKGGSYKELDYHHTWSWDPAGFTQVQKIITGPEGESEGFVRSRMKYRTPLNIGLESGCRVPQCTEPLEADVGFMAITSTGEDDSLFEGLPYYLFGQGTYVNLTHNVYKHNTAPLPSTPVVLAGTIGVNEPESGQVCLEDVTKSSVSLFVKTDDGLPVERLKEHYTFLQLGEAVKGASCTPKQIALEVAYVQELTQSFNNEQMLKNIQDGIPEVFDALTNQYASVRVSHIDFTDKPVGDFGYAGADWCSWKYHSLQHWAEVKESFAYNEKPYLGSGKDYLENQLDAVIKAAFRSGFSTDDNDADGNKIVRVALLVTEKLWHQAGDNPEGAEYELNDTYQCEDADYPSVDQLFQKLNEAGIHLIVASSNADVEDSYVELAKTLQRSGSLSGEVALYGDDFVPKLDTAFANICPYVGNI